MKKISIFELSFKVNRINRCGVINYFSDFGLVEYYTKSMRGLVSGGDVLICADGGFGCSEIDIFGKLDNRYANFVSLIKYPRYAIGFSDATFYLNYLIYSKGIPCFYGLNAIDFVVDNRVSKKYPDIFKYCDNEIKRCKKHTRKVVGGNLVIFNLFISYLSSYRINFTDYLSGKVLFFEEGGFNKVIGDGAFILDLELENLRILCGVKKLSDIFSGIIFGGIQDDCRWKNDYMSVDRVLKKHFGRLKIKWVNCSHDDKYVNDLILFG